MSGFRFHPSARKELREAAQFYDSSRPGLGAEFAEQVYASIAEIAAHPERSPILEGRVRRSVLRRFPYSLLYYAGDSSVLIIAVMHQRRKPGYWSARMR